MIEFINVAVMAFAMAGLNRLRGTGDIPVVKNGGPIVTVILGLTFWYLTANPFVGGGVAIAYFVGEMFSWGKWLRTVPHFGDRSYQPIYNITQLPDKDGRDSGIHFIASRLYNESKNFTMYCKTALVLRGIWWWAPVYAVLVGFGIVPFLTALTSVMVLGLMFFPSYMLSVKIKKDGYWARGEIIYGFVQGLVLGISMWSYL